MAVVWLMKVKSGLILLFRVAMHFILEKPIACHLIMKDAKLIRSQNTVFELIRILPYTEEMSATIIRIVVLLLHVTLSKKDYLIQIAMRLKMLLSIGMKLLKNNVQTTKLLLTGTMVVLKE